MQKINNKWIPSACLLLLATGLQAQLVVQNTGTLYITGSPDIVYLNGSLTNASTAALTNNGNVYLLKNLVNDQAAMSAGTGTLYLSGSATQTLSGVQPFKTYNLISNNAAGITLNNGLIVTGVHTFTAGIITTSATPDYLMYEAGASYSGDGDTRHVKGWVRKTGTTAFTFPVGNGTVERTIAASNLSAPAVFNAFYAGPATNIANIASPLVTVDPYEYWIVNKLSGGTATIDLNWDNSKVAMPNYLLANIRATNYTGGYWTAAGSGATGNTLTTGTVSTNSIGSFGSFVVGSISFILPVNLLQFSARNNNGKAVVSWHTSDELHVSHYDIQRSDNGLQFYHIGTVAAHNLSAMQQYEFTDPKDLGELTYYRMLLADKDGKTTFSKVITVRNNGITAKYFTVANPVHNSIRLTTGNTTGIFEYRINTISGQTLQQGIVTIAGPGLTEISLLPSLKKGWYILQIEKPGTRFVDKLLVQ